MTKELNGDKLLPDSKNKQKERGAKMPYQYKKLRGRIVEKFGSIAEFSKEIGMSAVSVSKKLCGKTQFSQSDITEWAEKLDIQLSEYSEYFFA